MTDSEDEYVLALMKLDEMEKVENYLKRRRYHEHLPSDALIDIWETKFKAWFASRSPVDSQMLEDVEGELRLRDMEMPYHLVSQELEAMQAEIKAIGPAGNPGIRKRLGELLDKLDGEPN